MVNFPTPIHDYDSHSSALLVLFIFSDPCICSTVAFLPLGNSDQVVSDSLTFLQTQSGVQLFLAQLRAHKFQANFGWHVSWLKF